MFKDKNVRAAIVRLLREKNDKRAIATLVAALRTEPDLKVCEEIIRALKSLTGSDSEPLEFDHWYQHSEK